MAQIFVSTVAHFFVSASGSKFHERMAHFFIDIYTHWLLKIRQTDLSVAVPIHTHSLHVQGFCPLFAVSLAPIIAQIGGNVLWRNRFWAGQ